MPTQQGTSMKKKTKKNTVTLKQTVAASAKQKLSETPEALFHRLFYREHIRRLSQQLDLQLETFKSRKYRKFNLSLPQVVAILNYWVSRAEDKTLCNDICQEMYFCDLKKGHKGNHCEGDTLSW
jgi:hypothetical protein